MKQRGRKSAAALEIAPPSPVYRVARQKPPHDLTDEECEVWVAVVNDQPADWFTISTVPMLSQYCRHAIQARRIAELVEKAMGDPEIELRDYDRLLRMQDREGRALSSLAGRMRISQQALRTDRGHRAPGPASALLSGFRQSRPSGHRKPWEE